MQVLSGTSNINKLKIDNTDHKLKKENKPMQRLRSRYQFQILTNKVIRFNVRSGGQERTERISFNYW